MSKDRNILIISFPRQQALQLAHTHTHCDGPIPCVTVWNHTQNTFISSGSLRKKCCFGLNKECDWASVIVLYIHLLLGTPRNQAWETQVMAVETLFIWFCASLFHYMRWHWGSKHNNFLKNQQNLGKKTQHFSTCNISENVTFWKVKHSGKQDI